jgi:hypothetical protein
MKKAFLLLSLVATAMFGCKKTDNSDVKFPPGFVVNGVTDLSVAKDSSSNLFLSLEQQRGEQELVTLSVKDLPTGVKAIISPERGTPAYEAMINFRADVTAPVGDHNVKVVATSKSGSKEYEMNLKITPITECAMDRTGTYNVEDACSIGPLSYQSTVFFGSSATNKNRIFFSNLFNSFSATVFADLNCDNATLVIPGQSFNGGTISGTGSYTDDVISLNYTVIFTGSSPITCSSVLTRM